MPASATKGEAMATGYVHVNGVTYTLWGPADAIVTTAKANALRAGSGTEAFDVVIDGVGLMITVQLDKVWASGAWSVEEPRKTVHAPHRIY